MCEILCTPCNFINLTHLHEVDCYEMFNNFEKVLNNYFLLNHRKLRSTIPEHGEILRETFDALMVCCGRYWDQAKPKIPGLERFRGVQVHSGEYRTFHPFVGKRVVVVGCGNSGGLSKSLMFTCSHVFHCCNKFDYSLWQEQSKISHTVCYMKKTVTSPDRIFSQSQP